MIIKGKIFWHTRTLLRYFSTFLLFYITGNFVNYTSVTLKMEVMQCGQV